MSGSFSRDRFITCRVHSTAMCPDYSSYWAAHIDRPDLGEKHRLKVIFTEQLQVMQEVAEARESQDAEKRARAFSHCAEAFFVIKRALNKVPRSVMRQLPPEARQVLTRLKRIKDKKTLRQALRSKDFLPIGELWAFGDWAWNFLLEGTSPDFRRLAKSARGELRAGNPSKAVKRFIEKCEKSLCQSLDYGDELLWGRAAPALALFLGKVIKPIEDFDRAHGMLSVPLLYFCIGMSALVRVAILLSEQGHLGSAEEIKANVIFAIWLFCVVIGYSMMILDINEMVGEAVMKKVKPEARPEKRQSGSSRTEV